MEDLQGGVAEDVAAGEDGAVGQLEGELFLFFELALVICGEFYYCAELFVEAVELVIEFGGATEDCLFIGDFELTEVHTLGFNILT